MGCRLIFVVVYEAVAHTHALYHPLHQHMHVLLQTYKLVTWSPGAVMIRLQGGGGNPTTRTIPPPHTNSWRTQSYNNDIMTLGILVHPYIHERDISFENFLTNIQSMFTGFEDNDEIFTEAQKIRILFQKVQSPILTQFNNEFQVSHNLYQYKSVIFNFTFNSMENESANLT